MITCDNSYDKKEEEPCIDLELENISSENDPFLNEYRLKRLAELQKSILQPLDRQNYYNGELYIAHKESELFEWTTKEPLVIVHFFHPSFNTCEILDMHLKVFHLGCFSLEISIKIFSNTMGSDERVRCAIPHTKIIYSNFALFRYLY